jgi:transcriptional regulator with XRE-family HTH domain
MSDLPSTGSTPSAGSGGSAGSAGSAASANGVRIPAWAWEREEIRDALRQRDAGAILRFAQQYGGASQSRIAAATGLLQGRVNEIVRGRRSVVRLDVFERIARGLGVPDDARLLMGLAPVGQVSSTNTGDLLGHPRVAAVARTKPEANEEIKAIAETVEEADVLAVRALGTIAMTDSLLRAPLTRPEREPKARVRVLVLDQKSPSLRCLAETVGETERFFAASLRFGEELLHELADAGTVDLEVYRYRSRPVWRIVRLDSTLFVSAIGPRNEPRARTMYRLAPNPPGAISYGFRGQLETLFDEAERII